MSRPEHRPRPDLTPEESDLRAWPDVRSDLVAAQKLKRFRSRKRAMELYIGGVSPEKIQVQTNVHATDLGPLLDRCLAAHPDGRIYGFRACIPGTRIQEYTRSKDLPDPKAGEKGGYAGAFRRFLNTYPDIEKAMTAIYLNRARAVGIGQEVRISIKSAKKRFDELCREHGIKSDQYPLNTEDGGRESLRRFFRSLHDTHYVAAVDARGDVEARVAVAGSAGTVLDREPLLPFEEAEFDGHTLDLEVEIELWLPSPTGVEVPVILSRLTLLVLMDRATTTVMSYQVVLHRNYNTTDVMLCFSRALEPWKPMELTIPNLQYLPGAGLPCGVIPECQGGACVDVLHWDNHLVHISPFAMKTIQQAVKCVVNAGKHRTPLARPLIELTFKLLEEKLHRLPGTTGSHPRDSRRVKQKGKDIIRLRLNELFQLLDVIICNHNAEPHARNAGMTPLQHIRAAIDQGQIIVRNLSEVEAEDCSLLKIRKRCKIKGNFKKSKRPYIEYKYGRYTSTRLCNMPSLIGSDLNVDFQRNDMRFAKAYTPDGALFDTLIVEPFWAGTPHTVDQRCLIAKMIKQKRLDLQAHPDPIHAAVDHLRDRALSSRIAASQYANLTANAGKPHGTPVPEIPPPPDTLKRPKVGGPWQPSRRNWIKLTKR